MIRPEEATNWEIFVWSLFLLGGSDDFVDVEAIFLRAFESAPLRLSWRTRPDLPDYKKCSKALRDAEARRPPLLIKTRDGLQRQLTVEGRRWAEDNRERLSSLLKSGRIVQEPRHRPRARLLDEIERSPELAAWETDRTAPAEKWQVAELLRCSPDSDPRLWRARLEILRSAADSAGRTAILDFLAEVERIHPDWFSGGER